MILHVPLYSELHESAHLQASSIHPFQYNKTPSQTGSHEIKSIGWKLYQMSLNIPYLGLSRSGRDLGMQGFRHPDLMTASNLEPPLSA